MCLALQIDHPTRLRERLTDVEILDWWRYYETEPWGELRADMRQEIGRQRTAATEAYDMPSWAYPYQSLAAIDAEETPAEFNARMRAKYEEIQRAKENREEL